MNLRLKTFGLALIALIAFSALSAPGASATAKKFYAEQNANLTGIDITETKLTVPGTGETTCGFQSYSATVAPEGTEVTASAHYTECKTSGLTTHVSMNECKYVFTLHTGTTSTGGETTHTHGPVHISCPPNKSITLTVTFFGFSVCTIHIGAQTPTTPTVDYKNKGTGNKRDVEITSTAEGITVVSTDEGGCEEGVHHNAFFTGTVTVRGYKDGSSHTEANQVGIWEE